MKTNKQKKKVNYRIKILTIIIKGFKSLNN